jgi:hypothetical protein
MVFNATFNNISVISLWSVLLLEETGSPGENHRPDGYRLTLTRWLSHKEQELLALPEHRLSPPALCGVDVARS